MPQERRRLGSLADLSPHAAMSDVATSPRTGKRPSIFHLTRHPIIEGYDPPKGCGWCYVDEAVFDLSDRKTPHNGPISRF
jgi:hypothetical protein